MKEVSFAEPMVSFSFDDGLSNYFEVVAPVLDAFGYKATFYIPSRLIGRDKRMSAGQLKQLQQAGHEVGAHGRRHRLLVNRWGWILNKEIIRSKKDLAALGLTVETFAYPFGRFDERAFPFLEKGGYTGARSNQPGFNFPNTPPYELRTFSVGPDTNTRDVELKIEEAIAKRAWLLFEFHQVEDSGHHLASSKHLFHIICDRLKSSNLKVVVVKEGIKELIAAAPGNVEM